MIRFPFLIGFALLGGAIGPTSTSGQESKPDDPAAKPPRQVAEAADGAALEPPSVVPQSEVLKDKPSASLSFDTWSFSHPRMADRAALNFEVVLEDRFGLKLVAADDAIRTQLEIPSGLGVVVVGVQPGSLAEQAGLKPNDILVSMDDQGIATGTQATQLLLGLGKKAVEVKLIREGKTRRMSLVGPEHGFPPEAAEYWIGVPVSPVDPTLRAHLPALPADAGLIVNDVVLGSPAEVAGVKKSDILITMGGKPLKTPDVLIERIQAAEGKPVPLEVLRAGKSTTLSITPAKRAHPTPINVHSRSGSPIREYLYFQPKTGIQTTTYGLRGWDLIVTPEPGSAARPKPIDIQLEMLSGRAKANVEEATMRIETQLKELTAKVEEIRKTLEALKKPESK